MGAIATFSPATWKQRYPEFNSIPDSTVLLYEGEATLYFANDGSGPVCDASQQLSLLNMVVAHVAYLNAPAIQGGSGSPLVGRINSATEGSVSVQAEMKIEAQSAQFWLQSKYGTSFWQATARYRTARYRAGPGVFGPQPFRLRY